MLLVKTVGKVKYDYHTRLNPCATLTPEPGLSLKLEAMLMGDCSSDKLIGSAVFVFFKCNRTIGSIGAYDIVFGPCH